MDKIEIRVLNPRAAQDAERMMVFSARLTQRGHQIENMDDLEALFNKDYTPDTALALSGLPHPTIQKFGVINVAVVGASRRFLAQITRHQNEVKFMSASLQYSDYSNAGRFVMPYNILIKDQVYREEYLAVCEHAMKGYAAAVSQSVDHDAAGYMAPQALRGALIISATPYQWKHMISQRVCKRNTDETRFVMLRIWTLLEYLCPSMFSGTRCGPSCMLGHCLEGKMACGKPLRAGSKPAQLLAECFPAIFRAGRTDEA